MLYYQTVSPDLLSVLQKLMAFPALSSFRLVGGTALALQIGHRTSVDIELFTDTGFDIKNLQGILHKSFPSFQMLWQNENGMSAKIDDVKVDLFNWHVKFVNPIILAGEIRMMDKKEVAAMKLEAVTDRKTKKDFADIFFLLQSYPLEELIAMFKSKYPFIDYKFVLESLLSIDEADSSEPPLMLQPFNWVVAKESIIASVNQYFFALRNKVETQQAGRLRRAEEILRNKKKN